MEDFGERRGGFRRRGFGGSGFNSGPKPVAIGDILDLTIEATGSRGDGIAKKDGFVIFVKGASQGQTLKVKIVSMGRSSATGEIVSSVSESAAPVPEAAPAEAEGETDGKHVQ